MTHLWTFLLSLMCLCVGFAIGVQTQPQVTRYSFTYGPVPATADLLGGK